MTRYGMTIRLRPGCEAEYRRLHAAAWPAVLATITACNIRNYSIYEKDGTLFSYFEHHGEDFAADMARMAADESTQRWWSTVKPLMEPLATRLEGEFWASMEEIFHLD
jgi:L-rhamnose mutarotase